MLQRFEQFIRERQYLYDITPRTIEWYERALSFLGSEFPTQDQLRELVIGMRSRGMKATGCNSITRAINAYLHWNHDPENKCGPSCKHPRIRPLKEPQLILPTFSAPQIKLLLTWKPRGFFENRLQLLVMSLLDTGSRITESLSVRVEDVDLDNLLVVLDGKGRKQRIVPFSPQLRKAIYRYTAKFALKPGDLLIACKDGSPLDRDNTLRAVRELCRTLGFSPPDRTQHAFRHTFAINYLRRGGSVFHLQKCLGHSTLEMTRRYANLLTEDLQQIHPRVSLLSNFR